MNKQEVFDRVVKHLAEQGTWSRYGGTTDGAVSGCAYRGGRGRKCAIGALITDEAYSAKLEGLSARAVAVVRALNASGIPVSMDGERLADSLGAVTAYYNPDADLLCELQSVHDTYEPGEWPFRLAQVADRHGLAYTPPAKAA